MLGSAECVHSTCRLPRLSTKESVFIFSITYYISNSTCTPIDSSVITYFHNRKLFVLVHTFSSTKTVAIGTAMMESHGFLHDLGIIALAIDNLHSLCLGNYFAYCSCKSHRQECNYTLFKFNKGCSYE